MDKDKFPTNRKFIVSYKLTIKAIKAKRYVSSITYKGAKLICFKDSDAKVLSHTEMVLWVQKLRTKGIKEIFIREVYP